jgi:hypothetical protein
VELKGDNVFLVGAGLSVNQPSCIPFAGNISRAIIDWVAQGNETLRQQLVEVCEPHHSRNPFDFIRFEGLIQAISLVIPNFANVLSVIETDGYPNAYHLTLVQRAMLGDTILTTNFDTRFEESADFLEVDFNKHVLSNDDRFKEVGGKLDLVKLHGSFYEEASTPMATLSQIGNLGLAFTRVPSFRQWFSDVTRDKNLVILGYSGLDSFDVVPLVEQCSRAKTTVWFDYQPNQTKILYQPIQKAESLLTPDYASARDLIDLSLGGIASTGLDTWRVMANDLGAFFSDQYADLFAEELRKIGKVTQGLDSADYALKNLACLNAELQSIELDQHTQSVILNRLFSGDEFGEHVIKPLADDEVLEREEYHDRVASLVQDGELEQAEHYLNSLTDNPDFVESSDYLIAKALFEMEINDVASAFATIQRWYEASFSEKNETTYELELMFTQSEFEHYFDLEDEDGMNASSLKLQGLAQDYGIIWGLVLSHHLRDILYTFKSDKSIDPKEKLDYRSRALKYAKVAAYYAIRTGRRYWFVKFVRRYAMLLSQLSQHKLAARELTRLLGWLDISDKEGRGMTLSSISSHHILNKDFKSAGDVIKSMKKIESENWSIKNVVISLVEIELLMAQGKASYGTINKLQDAREELDELDPNDRWNCVAHFEYLARDLARSHPEES